MAFQLKVCIAFVFFFACIIFFLILKSSFETRTLKKGEGGRGEREIRQLQNPLEVAVLSNVGSGKR